MSMQTQTQALSTWQIDPMHSLVEFAVRHMMIATVKGRFAALSGTIKLHEADMTRSSVEVAIEATGIDTREPQRDGPLRSADFLDADRFPSLTFRSKRVEPLDSDRYRVIGDLTIRDVTQEVALDAELEGRTTDPWGNERVGFSARTTIDRQDFGLNWNQALEAGGILVGNEVKISLEIEAVKQD
jgi:polyisoprenoid-binding protein YceI